MERKKTLLTFTILTFLALIILTANTVKAAELCSSNIVGEVRNLDPTKVFWDGGLDSFGNCLAGQGLGDDRIIVGCCNNDPYYVYTNNPYHLCYVNVGPNQIDVWACLQSEVCGNTFGQCIPIAQPVEEGITSLQTQPISQAFNNLNPTILLSPDSLPIFKTSNFQYNALQIQPDKTYLILILNNSNYNIILGSKNLTNTFHTLEPLNSNFLDRFINNFNINLSQFEMQTFYASYFSIQPSYQDFLDYNTRCGNNYQDPKYTCIEYNTCLWNSYNGNCSVTDPTNMPFALYFPLYLRNYQTSVILPLITSLQLNNGDCYYNTSSNTLLCGPNSTVTINLEANPLALNLFNSQGLELSKAILTYKTPNSFACLLAINLTNNLTKAFSCNSNSCQASFDVMPFTYNQELPIECFNSNLNAYELMIIVRNVSNNNEFVAMRYDLNSTNKYEMFSVSMPSLRLLPLPYYAPNTYLRCGNLQPKATLTIGKACNESYWQSLNNNEPVATLCPDSSNYCAFYNVSSGQVECIYKGNTVTFEDDRNKILMICRPKDSQDRTGNGGVWCPKELDRLDYYSRSGEYYCQPQKASIYCDQGYAPGPGIPSNEIATCITLSSIFKTNESFYKCFAHFLQIREDEGDITNDDRFIRSYQNYSEAYSLLDRKWSIYLKSRFLWYKAFAACCPVFTYQTPDGKTYYLMRYKDQEGIRIY